MKNALVVVSALVLACCATNPPPAQPGVAGALPSLQDGLLVQEEFYVPRQDEPLYGTWVNPALRLPVFYPKIILGPWGLIEYFGSPEDDVFDWRGTSIIVSRWTGGEGETWYRTFTRCSLKGFYAGHTFDLVRIGDNGRTLEFIYGNLGWPQPQDLDPASNPTYVRYRRLEP
jgi:hypothetical protein